MPAGLVAINFTAVRIRAIRQSVPVHITVWRYLELQKNARLG